MIPNQSVDFPDEHDAIASVESDAPGQVPETVDPAHPMIGVVRQMEALLNKIVAMINVGNQRSIRLAASLGFSPDNECISPEGATVVCYTQER